MQLSDNRRHRSWRRIAAPLGLAAALVAGSVSLSTPARAAGAPYTDPHSLGRAELLDSFGNEVLSGSSNTSFAAVAPTTVGTGLAEANFRGDSGDPSDSYAAQTAVYTPVAGTDPGGWSGNPVTAATTQTSPATDPPTASNSAANASQNKSLETLISTGGGTSTGSVAGYYQIRLLSVSNDNGSADQYYTVDVSLNTSNHTFTVVGPGALTATTTTLSSSSSTVAPGGSVTLTAQVSPVPTPATNDLHDVTFRQGSTVVAAHVPVDSTGKATFTPTLTNAGSYSYTATYNGDSNDLRSISAAASVSAVTATTTTVSASPTNTAAGSPVTFTAQVSPTPDGGTVAFTEGSMTYASGVAVDSSGKAATTVSNLTTGQHTITATYSGDTTFAGSSGTSQAVTITASAGPAPYTDTRSLGRAELLDGNGNEVLSGSSTSSFPAIAPTTAGTGLAETGWRGDDGVAGDSYASQTAVYTPIAGADPSTWSGNPVNAATTQASPATNPPTASNSAANANQNKSLETLISAGGGTSTGSVANYYQIRLLSSDGDQGAADKYYSVDVAVNPTSHTFTVVGPGSLTATSTSLTTASSTIAPGGNVTLTAQVSPAPTPGSNDLHDVTFRQGSTVIAAHVTADSTGKATFTTTLANAGSYSYTATFNGDTNDLRSVSSAATVNVVTPTTTTVSASPTSATVGSPVTFTAQVSPTPSSGTVTFTEGSTTYASAVAVDSSGKATATVSTLPVGSHTITATYSGGGTFGGSNGVSQTVTVAAQTTTTTVSASPTSAATGSPVTFTAQLAPTPDGGTVSFTEGSTTYASAVAVDSSGKATTTVSSLPAGSHTITATYSGDADFSGSNGTSPAVTITTAPVTSGAPYSDPHSLGRAELLDSNGNEVLSGSSNVPFAGLVPTTTGTGLAEVNFRGDSGDPADSYAAQTAVYTPVAGTDPGGWTGNPVNAATTQTAPATDPPTATNSAANASQNKTLESLIATGGGTSTGSVAGYYQIRLLSVSNDNGAADSYYTVDVKVDMSAHTFTVVGPGSLTSTSTAITADNSRIQPGGSVTLTAQVTPTPQPGSNDLHDVTFRQAGTIVAAHVPVDSTGKATYTATLSSAGSYSYTATYNGDTNDLRSGSTATTVVVATGTGATATTTTVTASPTSATAGSLVTFTAQIAPTPDGGTVTFTEGSTVIASNVAVGTSGKAAATSTTLAVGTHTVTATYSGDANFTGSQGDSPVVTITPAPLATSVSLTADNASVPSGQPVTFTATVTPSPDSGSVTFLEGTTPLSSGGVSGGVAKFATSSLSIGSHTITAVYGGDASFAPSPTSNAVTITVTGSSGAPSTITTITGSAAAVAQGQPVTFTATISPTPDGGTVSFSDSGAPLGPDQVVGGNTAVLSTSALSVGVHSIVATFSGTTNFLGSVSSMPFTVTVVATPTPPPATTTTNAGTGTQVRSGPTALPVGITVSSPNGIAGVTVSLDGATPIALTASGSRYSTNLPLSNIKLGTHTLTFRTTDGLGNVTTSTSVFVLTLQGGVAAPNKSYSAVSIPGASVKGFKKTKFTGSPGGSGLTTTKKGASVSFTFYGNSLALHFLKNSSSGKVQITVDGKKSVVDLYSAKGKAFIETIAHLKYAKHTVQIVDLGTKNRASTGTGVTIGYIRPSE